LSHLFLVGQQSSYIQSIHYVLVYTNLTFAIIVVADDYDRSINEAIKVTKYVLIPFPSVFVFVVYGEGDGSVILIH
jgi:hypothetical protein